MISSIIGIHLKDTHLSDSRGNNTQTNDAKTVLDFLLKDYDLPSTAKVTWNLYNLVDIVCKLLPTAASQTLLDKDRVEIVLDDVVYRLFSSQGRLFSITKKFTIHLHDNFYEKQVQEVNIYHLAQYFSGQQVNSPEEIVAKGDELLSTLTVMGLGNTETLTSPIAIYDNQVLKESYIPTIHEMDASALDFCDYAYQAMGREWKAVYKLGHWTPQTPDRQAWDYDLVAGYPSFIRNFKDTNEATYWHSKHYERDADFGVCKGKLEVADDICALLNPEGIPKKGKYEDFITTEQWAYLNKYHKGHFEMSDGWFVKFHSDEKPFYDIITNLFSMRQPGGLQSTLAKAISVGIFGRMAQEYEERFGDYYNPIYALMCTSLPSLKLGCFIEDNNLQDDLISVTVDGFLASKCVPIPNQGVMGGWKRSESVQALVMSMGYQFVGDKKPQNIIYQEMMTEILAHPNKHSYKGVLLNTNMLSTNRAFKQFPKTGKQLLENIYTSEAITV